MSGTIGYYVQGYVDFATENGTVSNGGTWVLLAGPVVVALLGLYTAYNVIAAAVCGVRRMVRLARPAVVLAAPLPTPAPAPVARIRAAESVLVGSAA
ncbi:MAG: hypothetical protein ACT4QG_10890 [Sporichthyaceae bacterium]